MKWTSSWYPWIRAKRSKSSNAVAHAFVFPSLCIFLFSFVFSIFSCFVLHISHVFSMFSFCFLHVFHCSEYFLLSPCFCVFSMVFVLATFGVARLTSQTRKLWLVGRCRDRPSSALPFTCPNEKQEKKGMKRNESKKTKKTKTK